MSREEVSDSPLMGGHFSGVSYQNNQPLSKRKLVIILSIIFIAILISAIIVISVRSSQLEKDLTQSHNKKHHLKEKNEAKNLTCPDDSPRTANSKEDIHDSPTVQHHRMDGSVGQDFTQAEKFKALESVLSSKEVLQSFLKKNSKYRHNESAGSDSQPNNSDNQSSSSNNQSGGSNNQPNSPGNQSGTSSSQSSAGDSNVSNNDSSSFTIPSGGSNNLSTSTSNSQSTESHAVKNDSGTIEIQADSSQSKKPPEFKDKGPPNSRIATYSDQKETILPKDEESGSKDSSCYPLNTCPDNPKACYSEKEKCNGFSFCNAAFDELECACASYLASSKLCDKFFDCPDGSDERGTCSNCEVEEVQCKDQENGTDYCVPPSKVCDGYADCKDGNDEEGCLALNLGATNLASNAIGSPYTYGPLYWNVEGHFHILNINLVNRSTNEQHEIMQNFALEACNTLLPNRMPNVEVMFEMIPFNSTIHKASKVANLESENLDLFGNNDRFSLTLLEPNETTRITSIRCGEPECGVPGFMNHERKRKKREINVKIVGGVDASPKEWPFVVAIRRNGEFFCGGSIINPSWIVTAAHCMLDYNNKTLNYHYEAVAGMLRGNSPSVYRVTQVISEVYLHEEFNATFLMHDIALARVKHPFLYNMFTAPVCLPSKDTLEVDNTQLNINATLVNVNSTCYALGWGNTKENGSPAEYLQEVEITINETCLNYYNSHEMQICASTNDGGKDACQGDSGGPLVCQHPDNADKWFLGGIISHGIGCARPNEDGVFTRVSKYLDFIANIVSLPSVAPGSGSAHITNPDCSTHRCDGLCMPKSKLCDGNIDCIVDKSDEKYCELNVDGDLTFVPPPKNENTPVDILDVRSVQQYDLKNYVAYPYTEPDHKPCRDGFFKCKSAYQCIPENATCDYNFDCVDHSDEHGCTCLDYLKTTKASVICDGYPDCFDWEDEMNCNFCDKGHYYCDVSNVCIPKYKLCDNTDDCPKGEDERYCFHLFTDSISIQKNGKPKKSRKGYLAYNSKGDWLPVCVRTWNKELTDKACLSMTWKGGKSYKTVSTDSDLDFKVDQVINLDYTDEKSALSRMLHNQQPSGIKNNKCFLIHVECEGEVACGIKPLYGNLEQETTLYGQGAFPWHITLYKNGEIACGATLVSKHWIITHADCAKKFNIENGADVLMARAGGHRNLPAQSYYDQYSRVVHLVHVPNTRIVLGMLKDPYKLDEYVNAVCIPSGYWLPISKDCFITGKYGETLSYPHMTKVIGLCNFKSDDHFDFCTQQTRKTNECMDNWSGALVCRGEYGTYYAVGIYFSEKGNCHFEEVPAPTQFESLITTAVREGIVSLMRSTSHSSSFKNHCPTKLCPNGKCLLEEEICNNYPDCGDLSDENEYYCKKYNVNTCKSHNNTHCLCKHDEMLCGNGVCLDKSKYCNKINDCGDWTDEPHHCENDCPKYLSVVNPHQMCDGHVDCIRSNDLGKDEAAERCCSDEGLDLHDNEYAFRCVSGKMSGFGHNLDITLQCINSKAVCDWDQVPESKNCDNGADEEKCMIIWPLDHQNDDGHKDPFGRYLTSSNGSGFLHFIAFGQKYLYCAGADTWTGQYRELYARLVCQHLGYSDVHEVKIHDPKTRIRIGQHSISLSPKEKENFLRCFLIHVTCSV